MRHGTLQLPCLSRSAVLTYARLNIWACYHYEAPAGAPGVPLPEYGVPAGVYNVLHSWRLLGLSWHRHPIKGRTGVPCRGLQGAIQDLLTHTRHPAHQQHKPATTPPSPAPPFPLPSPLQPLPSPLHRLPRPLLLHPSTPLLPPWPLPLSSAVAASLWPHGPPQLRKRLCTRGVRTLV